MCICVNVYKGADTQYQEIVVWDSDPDFIEYKHSPATPEGPSENKAPESKKASGPSTIVKSRTKSTIKLEPAASSSFVSTLSTTTDAGSVSGLPSFVRASWISRFLPTLYHRFGSSRDPWKMFTKGDEMLLIIQEVINAVYPDITYRAKWGDKICTAVPISHFLFATYFYSFIFFR